MLPIVGLFRKRVTLLCCDPVILAEGCQPQASTFAISTLSMPWEGRPVRLQSWRQTRQSRTQTPVQPRWFAASCGNQFPPATA